MTTTAAFDRLNPAQREAATYGEARPGGGITAPPLLVIAGAGTGKTNTLAYRVAHLLLHGVLGRAWSSSPSRAAPRRK